MRSLFQTRFPRFYRKWSGDRDVSARATHLKAAMENVFMTTTERKRMSTKTTFKRIALVAVAALGLGVLSTAPSSAVPNSTSLAIDAGTDTAYVGDTATSVLTLKFQGTATYSANSNNNDTATIRFSCEAPSGVASCPTPMGYVTQTSDTSSIVAHTGAPTAGSSNEGSNYTAAGGGIVWVETSTSNSMLSRSVVGMKAVNFSTAGVYTYTFYVTKSGISDVGATGITWAVTVSARDAAVASGQVYIDSDNNTAWKNRIAYAPASDSAVVYDKGTSGSYTAVAYATALVKNAAGDTRTATSTAAANTSGATVITDSVTVTLAGPGMLTGISATKSKVAYIDAYNGTSLGYTASSTAGSAAKETVTVWNDGTAGTATLTFTSTTTGALLGTAKVTFTGTPASNSQIWLSDSIVVLGQDSPTVTGIFKDSGSTVLKSGTVYVFSTDTAVAGVVPTSYPNMGNSSIGACSIASTGKAVCQIPVTDTGSVSITFGDSWTVAASAWTSSAVTLTVTGATVKTLTAAFDKANYLPGERAVITLTAKDSAGKAIGTSAVSTSQFSVLSTPTLNYVTGTVVGGTQSTIDSTKDDDFVGYLDTGVETRVVTMPTVGGSVTYALTFATFGSQTGAKTTVTATATVTDPTKDAADAATDAALEATDAAYAAQDAAQLAAEAADAATAAAEAATAAVEDLATQVASLFADLQKQITTLANVVAKIAKKVKA